MSAARPWAELNTWPTAGRCPAIARLASGTPLTITSGRDNNNDGNANDRADAVAGANPVLDADRPRSQVVEQWVNSAAFIENRVLTNGNTARNISDGPGYKMFDLGMYRDFGIGAGREVQFRIEATNALNMAGFPSNGCRSARMSAPSALFTFRLAMTELRGPSRDTIGSQTEADSK